MLRFHRFEKRFYLPVNMYSLRVFFFAAFCYLFRSITKTFIDGATLICNSSKVPSGLPDDRVSLETLPFIRSCYILACLSLSRPGRSPVSFCAPAQRHCQLRTPCPLYATGIFPGSRRLNSWRRFTTKCSEEFVPTVPPLILNGTPLTAGGPAFSFFPLLDPDSWVLDPSSLPALVWASLRPYFLSPNSFDFQYALTLYNSPFTVRFGMSAHTLPQRPALGSSHR